DPSNLDMITYTDLFTYVFYGRGTLANGVTPPTNPWRRISGYGCRATERGSSCSPLAWHAACETALRPAAGVAPPCTQRWPAGASWLAIPSSVALWPAQAHTSKRLARCCGAATP